MQISSLVFINKGPIPEKYSAHGENINPPLQISDVPAEAISLTLIMDDPDAPIGTFTHWLLWNINPKISEIKENSVPAGAMVGAGTSDKPYYTGPRPPSGTHRYIFHLYALDTILDIPEQSRVEDLNAAMAGHILKQAELTGIYAKS